MQWHWIAFRIALAAAALYAWRRGGAPERWAAAMFVAATIASMLARSRQARFLFRFEPGLLAVDLALLGGLLWLALRADRRWPQWCVAWHVVAVAGHLFKGALPHLTLPVYQVMLSLSSWPTLALLIGGTWRHQKRLAQNGADPSWSTSSKTVREPRDD